MKGIGYIYLTTNLLNGKQYVGQHLSDGFDNGYKGSGTYIKRALDKYGWDNFSCEIICWCSTQTQLNSCEDNYIRMLGTMYPNGYNLKRGGANGKYSKEARKNCSEAHIGKCVGQDNGFFGKTHSKESREKMSKALKGRVSPNKGKKASEETRKKNSESHKRYYESKEGIETLKKMSEAKKGKKANEETRKKMSESQKNVMKAKKVTNHERKYPKHLKGEKNHQEHLNIAGNYQKRKKDVGSYLEMVYKHKKGVIKTTPFLSCFHGCASAYGCWFPPLSALP